MPYNFENIVLTGKEKRFLVKLFLLKSMNTHSIPQKFLYPLLQYGLVRNNRSAKRNPFGATVPDGTCSTTDLFLRYIIYRRDKFFTGKFPVIISTVALMGAYRQDILWLLQSIAQSVKTMLGI